MTFIDWADPHEMFGLLSEYVADERGVSEHDRPRVRFLAELSEALNEVAERFEDLSEAETIEKLRAIRGFQPPDFAGDPVIEHLDACIGELERIRNSGQGS